MSLLFETVRIEDGRPANLFYHNKRMNYSRQKVFGAYNPLNLSDFIDVQEEFRNGLFRCRIVYGPSVESVEYSQYDRAVVKTLRMVKPENLKYDFKYLDRSCLTELISREIADDVLIVLNGCVTDSSFSNVAFYDGKRWATSDTPLLRGTMREMLIDKGIIKPERITPDNLFKFTHFRLINGMLGFSSPVLPINNIIR